MWQPESNQLADLKGVPLKIPSVGGGEGLREKPSPQRRGGFPDQQRTRGCRLRPQNPPEVPPCPRGDAVFIERGAVARHEKLLCCYGPFSHRPCEKFSNAYNSHRTNEKALFNSNRKLNFRWRRYLSMLSVQSGSRNSVRWSLTLDFSPLPESQRCRRSGHGHPSYSPRQNQGRLTRRKQPAISD